MTNLRIISSLDGDVITEKLAIGCDATSRTSATGDLLGEELGLDGHNKFESDTSLTRDHYFLGDGDNYDFNGTLFENMLSTCNNLFDRDHIAKYRFQRYGQSEATNPNFYYGPKSLLLYGAASLFIRAIRVVPAGESAHHLGILWCSLRRCRRLESCTRANSRAPVQPCCAVHADGRRK